MLGFIAFTPTYAGYAGFHAVTVSKATCICLVLTLVKFNFSKPMTRPDLSFIKITSSPVSSQMFHRVDYQTRPSAYCRFGRKTLSLGPYMLTFLYRVGWVGCDQKTIPIQPFGYRTHPSRHTFRFIEQVHIGIAPT
jgi:hypothetical protein